jgi:hypothetical protein
MLNLQQTVQDSANPPENASDATPRSLRKAINAHCKSCCYDPTPKAGLGTWREQVEACTVTSCSLYPVRPVSRPKKNTLPSDED